MKSPELESPEGMEEPALKLWLLTELKMPPEMVKAVSIEKITRVEDMPEVLPGALELKSKPLNGGSSIIPQPKRKYVKRNR
jgi:hypothetical protein